MKKGRAIRPTIPAATGATTLSERLSDFAVEWRKRGIPRAVSHEAKRLLLNQLKASVAATGHPAIRILHEWSQRQAPGAHGAHVLWLGTDTGPPEAAFVNGALFEVLDFHDTYIPCFMHAVSAVLPAVLAQAEVEGRSGAEFLTALALGLEIELAVARIVMPTGYYRGFVPAGLVGGVGAAAACGVLAGLDAGRLRNALGIALCTAFGTYESVGSMTLPYITGATARSGLTAFQLAAAGLDAPRTAFEGERGMLAAQSEENPAKIDAVLDTLGTDWKIFGQTYKTVPTETITHGPLECVLALAPHARGRKLARLRFGVAPIVVKIADERRDRFGTPDSELTARFDTRFCAAAAWVRGRFTLEEMHASAYTDPLILELRTRVELVADEARATFEGCWLEACFEDGTMDRHNVDFFLGTPGNPLSDAQLAGVFAAAAAGRLPEGRAERLVEAVWNLEAAADVRTLVALARLR
jgi:2-methylcitrate dehydratase PrpD